MTAIPLNRHEAARIAAGGIADYAARETTMSYDGMGDAAVTALIDLGALTVTDLDTVSEETRRREYRDALDRDQREADRERQAGAA